MAADERMNDVCEDDANDDPSRTTRLQYTERGQDGSHADNGNAKLIPPLRLFYGWRKWARHRDCCGPRGERHRHACRERHDLSDHLVDVDGQFTSGRHYNRRKQRSAGGLFNIAPRAPRTASKEMPSIYRAGADSALQLIERLPPSGCLWPHRRAGVTE